MREETNLTLDSIDLFGVYSDPNRDPRRHTVSIVYIGHVTDMAPLQRGDDAKEVTIVPLKDIGLYRLAFDHGQILKDFTEKYYPNLVMNAPKERLS